ncbi:MAG TPA: hypothetical protein VFV95_09765 [Vicinamibacterales bacterium]|nr:hypothetical protein [Vicinamibacterales bacterium]
MNPESDRRIFVRNMLAGIPALAGASTLSSTLHGFAGGDANRLLVEAPAAGIDRALRELSALYNQISERGPAPSDVKLVVPPLRSLVMYRQQSNRDIELAGAFRNLVAREGRERLSHLEPDATLLNQGLQHYGVRAPAIVLAADSRRRGEALDVLVKEGPGAFYEDMFGIISTFEYAIENLAGPTFCDFLYEAMRVLEAMAAVMCVATVLAPIFGPECFASSVILAIFKLLNFFAAC